MVNDKFDVTIPLMDTSTIVKSKKIKNSIFEKNSKYNTLNNMIFFDCEPQYIIGSVEGISGIFIPHFREWSFVHLTAGYSIDDVFDESNIYTYKNIKNYETCIDTFCTLYEMLNYPCIVAHNGKQFDFILIIAHIKRYGTKQEILEKLTFFDTFEYAKRNYTTFRSLTNTSLFLNFRQYYEDRIDIVDKLHNSKEDAQMMACYMCFTIPVENL